MTGFMVQGHIYGLNKMSPIYLYLYIYLFIGNGTVVYYHAILWILRAPKLTNVYRTEGACGKSAMHKHTRSLMLKTSGSWPAISMLNHFKW